MKKLALEVFKWFVQISSLSLIPYVPQINSQECNAFSRQIASTLFYVECSTYDFYSEYYHYVLYWFKVSWETSIYDGSKTNVLVVWKKDSS